MRKLIIWAIALAAVIAVLVRSDDIALFLTTVSTGAWLPLLVAAGFEVCKFFSQSFAVCAAFEATGARRRPLKLLPVVFSAMFVNSLAPSGGTAGTLLYIEDARRDGISVAQSTPAIVLYDVAYFLGFMVIMVIGFTVLALTHAMTTYYLVAGVLLFLIVLGLSLLLIFSKMRPDWVHMGADWVEDKLAWFVKNKLKRTPPKPWAEKLATSFCDAASSIAAAPKPAVKAAGYMTLTAGLDMLAMTAIGFAFGFYTVPLLVASYVVAQLLTIFSPTPQGVGIVEAGLALLLATFGVSVSVATAIALVYRGYVYWIPFLLGALSLRKTKLLAPTQPPTTQERDRDSARGTALVIIVLGIVSIVFAIMPAPPGALATIATWLSNGATLTPTSIVVAAIILILLSRGIWMQRRLSWALCMVTLVLMTIFVLTSGRGMRIALVLLVVAAWLFYKRRVFSHSDPAQHMGRRLIGTIVYAVVVAVAYGTVGYLLLSDDFEPIDGVAGAIEATFGGWLPLVPGATAVTDHGAWFVQSSGLVMWIAVAYAVIASVVWILFSRKKAAAVVTGDGTETAATDAADIANAAGAADDSGGPHGFAAWRQKLTERRKGEPGSDEEEGKPRRRRHRTRAGDRD